MLGAALLLLAAWLVAPWLRTQLLSIGVSFADTTVAQALRGWSGNTVVALMQALSLVHGTTALLGFAALGAVFLWRARMRDSALLLLVTLPGGMLLNFAIKTVVQRARPHWDYTYQLIDSFSFPSGHAAGATLLWGLLFHASWPRVQRPAGRAALLIVAAGMALLVAASRIILGVHYFSDCVGGILLGLVWLAICLAGTPPLFSSVMKVRTP